jgi:hypothetical protein
LWALKSVVKILQTTSADKRYTNTTSFTVGAEERGKNTTTTSADEHYQKYKMLLRVLKSAIQIL